MTNKNDIMIGLEKQVDSMSKDELIEIRESSVNDEQKSEKEFLLLDPKIQMALDMFRMSVINSRAYADSVDTEEKRIAQINRVQQALDRAAYLEASAYWSPENNRPLRKNRR